MRDELIEFISLEKNYYNSLFSCHVEAIDTRLVKSNMAISNVCHFKNNFTSNFTYSFAIGFLCIILCLQTLLASYLIILCLRM